MLRTKDQLDQQIAAMIDSAGTPRVTAADLRAVLKDFSDSMAPWTFLSGPTGTVPNNLIPSGIMRDSELTASAVRTLLKLSSTEVDALLTGGSISGRRLTFTQNDGTSTTIDLPADTDTHDGVITRGAFDSSGTELTLTLADSSTIVISVPSALRTGTGSGVDAAGVKQLIKAALTAALTGNTETGIVVTYNADGTIDFVIQAPAQIYTNYVGITDGALSAVTASDFTVSGVTAALVIPAYMNRRRVLFARPSSEADPSGVYLYQSGNRNTINQISTFIKNNTDIQLGGEAHKWWGGVDLLTGAGGYVLEQVN